MGCSPSKADTTTPIQPVLPGETSCKDGWEPLTPVATAHVHGGKENGGASNGEAIPSSDPATRRRRPSIGAALVDMVATGVAGLTGAGGAKEGATTTAPDAMFRKLPVLKEALRGRKIAVSDFELGHTVGIGSFGRVRVAWLKDHVIQAGPLKGERPVVAMKIMNKMKATKKFSGIGAALEAIRLEVRVLKELEFPFVVNLITVFHDDRRVYLLMEFVNAGELARLIYSSGSAGKKSCCDPETAKFFFAEILLALHEMHEAPHFIAYRDLKPENVLVSREGHAKLVDFGLAKKLDGTHGRTRTNCGTLEYQAPEMLLNEDYGFAVDFWALGVVLFELLAKRTPWGAKDPFKISQMILSQSISWGKEIPKKGKDLISRMLKFNEADRLGGPKLPSREIRSHGFLSNLDWGGIRHLSVKAPYTPAVTSDADTQFFASYPESNEESGGEMAAKDKKLWDVMLESVFNDPWVLDASPARSVSMPMKRLQTVSLDGRSIARVASPDPISSAGGFTANVTTKRPVFKKGSDGALTTRMRLTANQNDEESGGSAVVVSKTQSFRTAAQRTDSTGSVVSSSSNSSIQHSRSMRSERTSSARSLKSAKTAPRLA